MEIPDKLCVVALEASKSLRGENSSSDPSSTRAFRNDRRMETAEDGALLPEMVPGDNEYREEKSTALIQRAGGRRSGSE